MPHTFKHLTHDESLVLVASVIDLVKRHKSELYESLSALDPEFTDQERKDMINEILINFAEDFDLSADLVIPGEGYRRSQKRIFQDLDFEYLGTSLKGRKTKKTERSSPAPKDGSASASMSPPKQSPPTPPVQSLGQAQRQAQSQAQAQAQQQQQQPQWQSQPNARS